MPHQNDQHEDRPSRTQMKKHMAALQKMGDELAALSTDQIRKAGLPPLLEKEILFAKSLKKHEAKRRHSQYVGKIMRDVDTGPIRAYLDDIRSGRDATTREFHQVEQWRDALVGGDDALVEELFERFPDMDGQRFRQIVRNARKERDTGAKPKAFRELFRLLRDQNEAQQAETESRA
ncbi:ribosome biogenesis factor YjgA [Pseudodesulfovibrio senegalensis]|jgi:ribosome-associated protein|uniref:DUF615 domain-containing protein n=1 Tax=Pseudodesulfovibrio senegalensis TaxID=1721087 RepID=A0A6N6N3S9_9BACT|nr:ribosome biogenesis factor YjgA [Pseudodesulfovibrio senegalensis]KAB1442362.1 DUF615 domain-containing protein [Pseudodesulfovibrio senegalensis]